MENEKTSLLLVMTAEEKEELYRRAKKSGLTMSAYLRWVAIYRKEEE